MTTASPYLAEPVKVIPMGARVDLTDHARTSGFDLRKLIVELYWGADKNSANGDKPVRSLDIDAMCAALNKDGNPLGHKWFIHFDNPSSTGREIVYSGGSLTGDGPNEMITVWLSKLPTNIDSIHIGMFIFMGALRKQNFGQLNKAFARVRIEGSPQPPIQIDLTAEEANDTGLTVVRIYRRDGNWRIDAIKRGYEDGLQGFVNEHNLPLGPNM